MKSERRKVVMPTSWKQQILVLAVLVMLSPATGRGEERQPVYVGARVCATCHDGDGMGCQFGRWRLTKHPLAWAALALPEARPMAELSGIPVEPQEAIVCLGCHATAAEAEDWEKDPTFFIEDGVQCEKCHGPGSEYMDEDTMRDPEAAARAGLRKPTVALCQKCHYVKGSHVAVHKQPQLDIEQAFQSLAHPTPADPEPGSTLKPPDAAPGSGTGPAFTGVQICGRCHRGPEHGYQYSLWRLGPHARAYAVLKTEAADRIARELGIDSEPRETDACLRCHVTGGGAAAASGLKSVTEATCNRCHDDGHGRPFDYAAASRAIAHPNRAVDRSMGPRYKTPVNLATTPDGGEIWIASEASDSVIVVDVDRRSKTAEIAVGGQPHDIAFSPDGRFAYVSSRLEDNVSVIDTADRAVVRTVPVGDEPHGLLTDLSGDRLYVLNTAEDSISVVDTVSHREIKRLSASRNPWSLALSPDGERLLVTNTLSRFVEFRTPSMSEVTVIGTGDATVEERFVVPGSNLLQGVHWHPSGEFAFITLNRTKNLVPMTRILQGWTITNGLGILWRDGRVDQVLLDEPNLHFPDPADVAFTPDGRLALVTSSGSDRVAVVDVESLLSMLRGASAEDRRRVIPNHFGKSIDFIIRHVPTGKSPRGIVIGPDGETAFVANALDDSLTVIDMGRLEAVEPIDLGGPTEITRARFGERLFHSADVSFQRQFSCHTCHPDGHVDGITYDIEPDGIGMNPVDNRSLRGILDTDPFKWEGTNPTLQRQCGPRLAVFFTRIQPFDPDQLAALENYIATIPRPPNRHRPYGADLTPAQRRGKRMFERAMTNDGRVIPVDNRCVTCHFPPMFTDRSRRNVDTRMELDEQGDFDVPHLSNIYDSAPYMHNGIAHTLEEIWTRYNPEDRHGITNDMTKDQLNDLIEYLKTL
jgi:YVTN family beta-propeller protein